MLPVLLLALIAIALALLAIRHLQQQPVRLPAAPTAGAATIASIGTAQSTTSAVSSTTNDILQPLAGKIVALTAPLQGTYGVWVMDLPTGASTGQHAQRPFVAASVIKFCILVALYEEQAKGQLSLNEKITTTAADIQNYGTGSIRYDPVGTSYTLADLAQRAAKQSDNTAAYLILQRLGSAYVQSRTNAWGLADTSITQDRTSPRDIGTLFAAVAQRRLLPAHSALDLLGILTNTDFEDRLPALLPPYVVVSHKIGTEANGVMNDAGLVVLPTRSYVLAVMTDGADPDQAITAEQQLSQVAFAYEAGLP